MTLPPPPEGCGPWIEHTDLTAREGILPKHLHYDDAVWFLMRVDSGGPHRASRAKDLIWSEYGNETVAHYALLETHPYYQDNPATPKFDPSQPIDWDDRLAWWCEETGEFHNTTIDPDYPMQKHATVEWCGVKVPPIIDPEENYPDSVVVHSDGTIGGQRHYCFDTNPTFSSKFWCLVNRYPKPRTVPQPEAVHETLASRHPAWGTW